MIKDIAILTLYGLSLRFFLFKYSKTEFLRQAIAKIPGDLPKELLQCFYCQTIESASLVWLCLHFLQGAWLDTAIAGFSILSVGWIAIFVEPWIYLALIQGASFSGLHLMKGSQPEPRNN